MEEVERKLRIFAREIEDLRKEIRETRRQLELMHKCINYLGRLSAIYSAMVSLLAYLYFEVDLEEMTYFLRSIIGLLGDYNEIVKKMSDEERNLLKTSIEVYSDGMKEFIDSAFFVFFDKAKEKKISLSRALEILKLRFEDWSFLEYISDANILETYGHRALEIFKKYKETLLGKT